MKSAKIIFLIASAVITLSFSFSTINKNGVKTADTKITKNVLQLNEPIGGFVLDDKIE